MKYEQLQDHIQHFSHHHVLVSLKPHQLIDDQHTINYCNACQNPIIIIIFNNREFELDHHRRRRPICFHGCLSCNFFLHDDCLNTPRFLHHPSHLHHSLTLIPTPTYSTRSYSCNACGSPGTAFSLSCAECDFDLHLHCAHLPPQVVIEEHPHELKLMFGSPYEDKSTKYGCDLCSEEMQPNYWLYYCPDCDFGAHLDCVTDQGKDSNPHTTTEEQYQTGTTKEGENHRPQRGKSENRGGKISTKETQNNKREVNQQRDHSDDHQHDDDDDDDDTEKSFYEAQKEMRETAIAHKIMLQALDNAADYVGSSSRRYYYY